MQNKDAPKLLELKHLNLDDLQLKKHVIALNVCSKAILQQAKC